MICIILYRTRMCMIVYVCVLRQMCGVVEFGVANLIIEWGLRVEISARPFTFWS